MIVVTGATGKLGKLIVDELVARMPVSEVGVSIRDSKKATNLQQRGIRMLAGAKIGHRAPRERRFAAG